MDIVVIVLTGGVINSCFIWGLVKAAMTFSLDLLLRRSGRIVDRKRYARTTFLLAFHSGLWAWWLVGSIIALSPSKPAATAVEAGFATGFLVFLIVHAVFVIRATRP